MYRRVIPTSVLALAVSALSLAADDPPEFQDFTFRRVKPPTSSGSNLIDIQIDEFVLPQVEDTAAPEVETQTDVAAWFWDEISPDLSAANGNRLETAMQQLRDAPGQAAGLAPSVEHLRRITREHGTDILMATLGTKISPAFVLAIIGVESSGNQNAESSKGAKGLMQLIPATATRFDVEDPSDPQQNIRGGVAYLQWLLEEFDRDPLLALAGYNAGENAVRNHLGVPPYPETRAYVLKVVAAWQVARALCITPPDHIGDGCVFAVED